MQNKQVEGCNSEEEEEGETLMPGYLAGSTTAVAGRSQGVRFPAPRPINVV